MQNLVIPRHILDQALAHCLAHLPDEACGIMAGKDMSVSKFYGMTNTEPSPVSYFMKPEEQFLVMKEIRNGGLKMLAILHSHPSSPAFPSAKDVSLAFYDDAVYMIIGLTVPSEPEIKAYTIIDGIVKEAPFAIK